MTESAEFAGDRIVATYDLHDTERSPEALAAAIALEQTVEVPQALVDAAGLPPGIVGEVEGIDVGAGAGGAARARLSYDPSVVEACGLPALVNLVFGNVSMMPGVRLVDVVFPDRVLAGFDGPRHGVTGVRALTGVYGRPLLATALKPRGVPVSRLVGDGWRIRTRRWRHRQGRPEPHRRLRGVQGPGEAVRRRGGRREPVHRTPLPVPPLRHRSPARAHPSVRVRGTVGARRGAGLPVHRRARHRPIPSRATTISC